jgi:DNA-directed RNA polymerase subunit M/transcription elongation factor TFIIS
MKFCPICESYLLSEIVTTDVEPNPNKLLRYKCNNCGYTETNDVSKSDSDKCIYKTGTKKNNIKINTQNLKYLKYDRTLPHIDNINCTNDKCPTRKSGSKLRNDVLYMNLNDNMITYLYQCCHCTHTWTNK